MTTHHGPPTRYAKTNKPLLGGGYGIVEIFKDTWLDRDVAVKWTAPKDADQLLKEVHALSQRHSPYVVEIYDVILDPQGALRGIVLEYLSGDSFEGVDLTDASSVPRAVGLLYQMAQGLADLHAAGLVHRDIKPSNAVCTTDGRLKLVDFGLSSPSSGAYTIELKGTPGFAAPEFDPNKPAVAITRQMDAYSFGAVCWKQLIGALPKTGSGYPGVHDPMRYPLPSIATQAPALPTRIATVIDQCLAWDPNDRPLMQDVAAAFMAELTFGRHTACVMMAGETPQDVTTDPKKVSSITTKYGSLDIGYDGYQFTIKRVQGDVFVNNATATVGQRLHEGCLLTFGAKNLGGSRKYVPFRQSSPVVIF